MVSYELKTISGQSKNVGVFFNLELYTLAQANIKNPRDIGEKINKAFTDLGKGIKGLFKKK